MDGGGGASDTALEWVQALPSGAWAILGVLLGYYLSSRARRVAYNEQHVLTQVEAARDSFLAARLAAYHIANRLHLHGGQELVDLWTPELKLQIEDLVWQLYDHEFMLNERKAQPVAARFDKARKLIQEIIRAAEKPDGTPAAERTQRHREAVTQLVRLLEDAPRYWNKWKEEQWDLVRTRPARYRARRRRSHKR